MRYTKKWIAAITVTAMLASLAVPASALISAKVAPPKTNSSQSSSQSKEAKNAVGDSKSGETPKTAAKASGAFTGSTSLVKFLYEKMQSNPATVSIPVSKLSNKTNSKAMFNEIGDAAEEAFIQNGLIDHITSMNYSYTSGASSVTLKLTYNDTNANSRKQKLAALTQKADSILSSVVTAGMSDEEKATALFQYVSNNVTYDFAALNDFLDSPNGKAVYARQTAYSSLVEGKAICQGFARGYKLLCDRAGVPCVVVFGQTGNGIAHSWNRIYIDGAWRTVDTSNRQLRICGQNGIYIDDAVAKTALIPNKQSIVDAQASKYY